MDDNYFYKIGFKDGMKEAKSAYVTSFYIGFILVGIVWNVFPLTNITYGVIAITILLFTLVVPQCILASKGVF